MMPAHGVNDSKKEGLGNPPCLCAENPCAALRDRGPPAPVRAGAVLALVQLLIFIGLKILEVNL